MYISLENQDKLDAFDRHLYLHTANIDTDVS